MGEEEGPMPSIKWIIWFAITTHLLWGTLILSFGESVTWITAIHHTQELIPHIPALGVVYLLAGLASIYGAWKRVGTFLAIVTVLPQQFLLIYSAVGAIQAIALSQFADGVIRPREFLIADQFPAIFLAVGHTGALVEEALRNYFFLRRYQEPAGPEGE